MIKRKFIPLLIALFVGFNIGSAIGISAAQDATPESTPTLAAVVPVPTAEPTPVIIVAPPPADSPAPSDRALYVIGFVLFTLVSCGFMILQHRNVGQVIEVLTKALDNKQLQDEARQGYMESSMTTQQFVQVAESMLKLLSLANIPVVDPLIDKAADVGDIITGSKASVN